MLKISDLASLLLKFHQNKLTDYERQLLDGWKSESAFNQQKYNEITDPELAEKKMQLLLDTMGNPRPYPPGKRKRSYKTKKSKKWGFHMS